MENGIDVKVQEEAKKAYLDFIWKMDKEAMFKELMRVHAASAQLLSDAQAEIDRLKKIITTPVASNGPKH